MITIESLNQLLEIIERSDSDTYIAGAGNYGKILGDYLNANDIMWEGFLDVNENIKELCGKRVFPYSNIKHETYSNIIVSSLAFTPSICEKLLSANVKEEEIIIFSNTDIFINILNLTAGISSQLSKIQKYKSIHLGKRCFVIGNGPSLTINDLEYIKGEISFACNSIYALYNETNWRPTYYVLNDSMGVKMILSDKLRPKIIGTYETLFTGISHWNTVRSITTELGDVCFFKTASGIHDGYADFSEDVSNRLFTVGNITYIMLQLATYMGASEIYLLGVDFTFSVERSADGSIKRNDIINHNELIEKEERQYDSMLKDITGDYGYYAEIDYQLWGYQAAKKYADTHGIKIYNATRGGKLEVFPRVELDDLLIKH